MTEDMERFKTAVAIHVFTGIFLRVFSCKITFLRVLYFKDLLNRMFVFKKIKIMHQKISFG